MFTRPIRVLVACERSGVVREAFNSMSGFHAMSCDLSPCDDGRPDYHIQGDALEVIEQGWDAMIAHPPCTYLTVTGNKWFKPEYATRFPDRQRHRQEAIEFFMRIANAPIPCIAIENPVGIMSTVWRKADQVIQPFHFGDEASKGTCLWLKNLPKLVHIKSPDLFNEQATHVHKGEFYTAKSGKRIAKWYSDALKLPPAERQRVRSQTFPAIARAMADQWAPAIIKHINRAERLSA